MIRKLCVIKSEVNTLQLQMLASSIQQDILHDIGIAVLFTDLLW